MIKKLLFINLAFLSFISDAQNFQWVKGIDPNTEGFGLSIKRDASGNIYTKGSCGGTFDSDPGSGTYYLKDGVSFIYKSNASGSFIWARSFPGKVTSFDFDAKDNVYVTGTFYGKLDFDSGPNNYILGSDGMNSIFILKLNSDGNLIFGKSIGGKNAISSNLIELDKHKNIYTTGVFSDLVDFDPGTSTYKINNSYSNFKLKLDSIGNFISVKIFATHISTPMVRDVLGNYYTIGSFYYTKNFDLDSSKIFVLNGAGDKDAFVLKTDSTGKFIWAKSIGGRGTDEGHSISVDISQNVYITGYFEDSIDMDPGKGTYYIESVGQKDVFVVKLNSSGNFVWGKSLGAYNNESGDFIGLDDSANVYVSGYFNDTVDFDQGSGKFKMGSSGYSDIFFLKLDKSGKFKWSKKIGGTYVDEIKSMVVDKSGNIYATGYFNNNYKFDFDPDTGIINLNVTQGSSYNIFILKLGPCPSPPSTIVGPLSVCNGQKAIYSVTPVSGANSYKWMLPFGSRIDSVQNKTTIFVTIGNTSGDIRVIANNACDTNNFSSIAISLNSPPKVSYKVFPSSTVCKGTLVTLSGFGADNYLWSKGIIDNIAFKADSSLTYILKGTDKKGCIGLDSLKLNIIGSLPKVGYLISSSPVVCSGTPVTLTGTGARVYSWSNNVVDGKKFYPDSSRKYTVTGIDSSGCKDSASLTLIVNQTPSFNLHPSTQKIIVGYQANFTASTVGKNAKTQWQQNSGTGFINLFNFGQFSGVNSDTLSIKNVSASQDNYGYRCITFDGSCSDTSNTALLIVKTTSIKKVINQKNFSIFPNPAHNFITIESYQTQNNLPFIITDQIGKQILKGELSNKTNTVDISSLASGFYFLKIGEANKEVFKIMKQ